MLRLERRLENLIGQWRQAADSLRESRPGMSSIFYDCANELEKVMDTSDNDDNGASPDRWDGIGPWD